MEKSKESTTGLKFIAFLDIMGFTEFVSSNEHSLVVDRLSALAKEVNVFTSELIDQNIISRVKTAMFSDTILIISEGNSKEDLIQLTYACAKIMYYCYTNQIPINGAISHGQLTADFKNSVFCGSPLIEAYHLQSELKLYSIVTSHSAQFRTKQIDESLPIDTKSGRKQYLYQEWYNTPFKSGKSFHHNINWLGIINTTDDLERIKKSANHFSYLVSGGRRVYVDNTKELIDFLYDKSFKAIQDKMKKETKDNGVVYRE